MSVPLFSTSIGTEISQYDSIFIYLSLACTHKLYIQTHNMLKYPAHKMESMVCQMYISICIDLYANGIENIDPLVWNNCIPEDLQLIYALAKKQQQCCMISSNKMLTSQSWYYKHIFVKQIANCWCSQITIKIHSQYHFDRVAFFLICTHLMCTVAPKTIILQ